MKEIKSRQEDIKEIEIDTLQEIDIGSNDSEDRSNKWSEHYLRRFMRVL